MKRNRPLLIIGPPGCGKTRNADRLASFYGCSTIVDEFDPHERHPVPDDALVLTTDQNAYVPGAETMSFDDAMRRMAH